MANERETEETIAETKRRVQNITPEQMTADAAALRERAQVLRSRARELEDAADRAEALAPVVNVTVP